MKRFTILSLLILTLLPSVSLVGQEFTGAASFFVGLPQGQLKDNVDNPGLGLTANIGYAPRERPIMVGLEFGFRNNGTERRRENGRVVHDLKQSKPTFFPYRSAFRLHSNLLPGTKPSMFTGFWWIVIVVSKKQQNYTSPVVRTGFDSPLHTLNTTGGITL